jgi:uncharacterized protein (TIGR02611 family)
LAVSQDETGGRAPLIERVRARRERHRSRNRIYRFGFAVAGFVVLLAGIVMLVTPGPGIPVVILGLGVLALEFAWAERWLERLIERAEQAVEQVTKGSPLRSAAVLGIGVLVAAALVATAVVLWDLPFLPG